MERSEPQRNGPCSEAAERQRLDDELVGLDRDDPDVRAFAEHLQRSHQHRPGYTVEGYLSGVTDFADSANRAAGGRRLAVLVVVALLLLVVAVTVWNAVAFVIDTFLG
ncbi:MAG: hypothetical protein GEV09_13205 [Pseudonocardiaceae bacterium]|nr:hypothetical protein [Pseudonocardiaceae bacterium]